jgi:hypothetical protein
MRGIECTTPNCAHLHAATDELLVDDLVAHSREVHSDAGLTSIAARRLAEGEAYEDSAHAGKKRTWADKLADAPGGWTA